MGMVRRIPWLMLALGLIGYPEPARAQIVHVDGASGDDSMDGFTPETAVATIGRGGEILAEEGYDQLVVAPGTYYEQAVFESLGGTEDRPIWIRAEVPGETTISGMWEEAAFGDVEWVDEGDGVYSTTHGPALFGSHDGTYLFRYNSEADLRTATAVRAAVETTTEVKVVQDSVSDPGPVGSGAGSSRGCAAAGNPSETSAQWLLLLLVALICYLRRPATAR